MIMMAPRSMSTDPGAAAWRHTRLRNDYGRAADCKVALTGMIPRKQYLDSVLPQRDYETLHLSMNSRLQFTRQCSGDPHDRDPLPLPPYAAAGADYSAMDRTRPVVRDQQRIIDVKSSPPLTASV